MRRRLAHHCHLTSQRRAALDSYTAALQDLLGASLWADQVTFRLDRNRVRDRPEMASG